MSTNTGQCPACRAVNAYTAINCLECGARLPWADAVQAAKQHSATPPAFTGQMPQGPFSSGQSGGPPPLPPQFPHNQSSYNQSPYSQSPYGAYAPPPLPSEASSEGDSPLALVGYALLSALMPCIGVIVGLFSLGKNPARGAACLTGSVLSFVVGFIFLSGSTTPTDTTGSFEDGENSVSVTTPAGKPGGDSVSTSSPDGNVVATKSEYNQIAKGMSYSDVCQIVGAQGVEEANSGREGESREKITTFSYHWTNADGSYLYCIFQDDRMVMKGESRLP